jgi:hypothetical protein
MANVDRLEIESDERGFELHVWVDEEPRVHDSGLMVLNIHSIDLDAFYDQVKARLGPYLREAAEARTAVAAGVSREAFCCDPDESGGYDLTDPKHPRYHSVHVDLWDSREGK